MKGPQLGLHVNTCSGPWTETDWERHRNQSRNKRTALRSKELKEGEDYVVCQMCGDRFRKLSVHLKTKHGLTARQYQRKFSAPTTSKKTLQKTKSTCLDKYGVDHPRKVAEINDRAEATRVATMLERYGAATAMEAGLIDPFKKNRLEKDLEALCPPGVLYVGAHSYWIRCLGPDGKWRNRNPDFVVYSEECLAAVSKGCSPNEIRTRKIIEALGSYWHGPELKGMSRTDYEAFRVQEYASVGVTCLVVWEKDLRTDPEAIRKKIKMFVEDVEGYGEVSIMPSPKKKPLQRRRERFKRVPDPTCSVVCPACQKTLSSPKALPKHTNGCPKWDEVIGVSPSKFNFERHFERGLWAPDRVESQDYVGCLLCVTKGTEVRVKRLSDHLKRVHEGMIRKEYETRFPGVLTVAGASGVKRKKTTQERYGIEHIGQGAFVKEKACQAAQERYGVNHHLQAEEVKRRRAKTNVERYGTENVFAVEEVQAKIRATNMERYGAENPQQVPEIKTRTMQTTLDRHGASSFLQSSAWRLELDRKRNEREQFRRETLIASGTYEACPHCDALFTKVTSRHKAVCKGWGNTASPVLCLCGHESTSNTQMKRHRRTCDTWTKRDKKAVLRARQQATLEARYGPGVTNARQVPGAEERRCTMLRVRKLNAL